MAAKRLESSGQATNDDRADDRARRRVNDLANLLLVGQKVPYNHLIGAYDAHGQAA